MGQALYRKYRSRSLDEVVGQEPITTTLNNALKQGKISHAYLFTGPRGIGKTSVARILAHEVNSLKYDEDSTHLDIIEIDAASNRRIDEIRDLREKVHISPTSAKYKVYIIDEVHMLTKEAFNALLKTLEEPPEHVIFILATTEVYKLPETIISRTQRYSFQPAQLQDIKRHLAFIAKKEKIEISGDALDLIAHHSDGSFRDAVSLLDQARNTSGEITVDAVQRLLGLAPKQAIEKLLNLTSKGSPKQILEFIDELRTNGLQSAPIAKQLGEVIRGGIIGTHKTVLDQKTSLQILDKLLNVASSSNPDRQLELLLIEQSLTNPEQVPDEPDTVPSPEEPPLIDDVKQSVTKSPPKPSQKAEFSLDMWPDVLSTLKKKHATLYGVIRLSEPSFDDNTLTLSFKFPFHKKRMSEEINQEKLSAVIMEICGNRVSITSIVSEGSNQTEKSVKEPKSPDLDTISNIFGHAEMLD